jgi:hypothetical protein
MYPSVDEQQMGALVGQPAPVTELHAEGVPLTGCSRHVEFHSLEHMKVTSDPWQQYGRLTPQASMAEVGMYSHCGPV